MKFKDINNMKIPGNYIIQKKTDDGTIIEQHVTVDGSTYKHPNTFTVYYRYYYGVYGFHEGYCSEDKIRELTEEEKAFDSKNQYWKLPQKFYQSIPD